MRIMTTQSVTPNSDNPNSDNNLQSIPDTVSARTTSADDSAWGDMRIWMWIASAFFLLFLLTLLIVAPQIQQRLDMQAKDRLEQAGINIAALDLDWDYRNLTVSGYLPEDVSPSQLAYILRGTSEQSSAFFADGIRHLRLNLDEGLPVGGGFNDDTLLVQISGDNTIATLHGVVQNEAQRKTLVDAMLASGVGSVLDELDVLSVADTSPVSLRVTALSNMLRELGPDQIHRSEIKMTEDELYYRITALNKESALSIEQAASVNISNFNVTGGVELLSTTELDLLAESDGEKIVLSGEIYSASHRKRLVFAASEAVGIRNVVDSLVMAGETSDASSLMTRVDSMAEVISRLAPGISGNVMLKNVELIVDAETGSEEVRDYLLASTDAALNAGLNVIENIQVIVPQDDSRTLQLALNELISEVRETVVFSSGETGLSPAAMLTLDKVAQRISKYSSLVVEIEGHTDNVGRAGVNERLSQSRANAVRSYLAEKLVGNNSQLIAVGYGHRRPIETNDTAEGRQANRRVHFTVLKKPENLNG